MLPSTEQTKLIELLNSFETTKTNKSKSELLSKAKYHILNEMKPNDINAFFIQNKSNFEGLFHIDVWTSNLDETNGITNFIEPYEIIDHIFNIFNSLSDLLFQFYDQIVYLLHQTQDENVKHICVKLMLRFTNHFSKLFSLLTYFLLKVNKINFFLSQRLRTI